MAAAGPVPPYAKQILESRDRAKSSDITYLGRAVYGAGYYEVYRLDFINPQSKHGTRFISLIRDGSSLAGSFAINGHASATEAEITSIEGDIIIFSCGSWTDRVKVVKDIPSKLMLCGMQVSFIAGDV